MGRYCSSRVCSRDSNREDSCYTLHKQGHTNCLVAQSCSAVHVGHECLPGCFATVCLRVCHFLVLQPGLALRAQVHVRPSTTRSRTSVVTSRKPQSPHDSSQPLQPHQSGTSVPPPAAAAPPPAAAAASDSPPAAAADPAPSSFPAPAAAAAESPEPPPAAAAAADWVAAAAALPPAAPAAPAPPPGLTPN